VRGEEGGGREEGGKGGKGGEGGEEGGEEEGKRQGTGEGARKKSPGRCKRGGNESPRNKKIQKI
jgi:hypothetical protein